MVVELTQSQLVEGALNGREAYYHPYAGQRPRPVVVLRLDVETIFGYKDSRYELVFDRDDRCVQYVRKSCLYHTKQEALTAAYGRP